jgi:hypothetical protein
MDLHMGNKWSFCLSASEIAPTSRGSRDQGQALVQSEAAVSNKSSAWPRASHHN